MCAGLLAGCSPMEWRRGEEVATAQSEVVRKCRDQAIVESQRRTPFFGHTVYPIVSRDAAGLVFVQGLAWNSSDRLMAEHLAMMQCMNDLGYRLEPVKESANAASPEAVQKPNTNPPPAPSPAVTPEIKAAP